MVWRVVLQPYIQRYGSQNDIYNSNFNFGVFTCPSQPGSTAAYGPTSYGYNAFGGLTLGWQQTSSNPVRWGFPGASLASIQQPSKLIMFADAAAVGNSRTVDPNFNDGSPGWTGCGQNENGPYNFNPEVWREDWSVDWDFGVPGSGTPNSGEDWGHCRNGGRRPMPRHNKHFNAVFVDGHVKAIHGSKLRALPMTSEDLLHNHNR